MVAYLLRGLDAYDLKLECEGSMHFLHNLTPELYDLRSIQLFDGRVHLDFVPGENLPEPLHVRSAYRLTLAANENIEIISKQISAEETIYSIINCKSDANGRQFFHFDVLRKTEENENSHIPFGLTMDELIAQGFITTQSEDCASPSGCKIIVAAA